MNQPRHEPLMSRPLPRSMYWIAAEEDDGWWGCTEHEEWSAESDEESDAHAAEPHAAP